MSDGVSATSRLVGHNDRDQPTPLSVSCSIRSDQDRAVVVDCLGSFGAVTVSTVGPESVVASAFDLCVIDQSTLDAVGDRLRAHQQPCLLVTDDGTTLLPAESTTIPDDLKPVVTDLIASPVEETELRRRLRVLVEMQRQSKQLARSTAHHKELVETLPEAVLLVSNGAVQYANSAAETLFGATASTLTGTQFTDYLVDSDQSAGAELLDTALRSTTTEFVDLELGIDGQTVHIEAAGTAVGLDGDTVELVCRDRTERHQHEARLRLYETAMDEATVGITITDARQQDNPLVYVNREFERLTGLDSEEMLGRNPRIPQSPRADPETVAEIREAVDNGESISVELLNQSADGTEWYNALDISPVHQDGELTHFLGFQRDVTATRSQQNQLAVLDRVLRHNLRNRLNVVLGHAETIKEGTTPEQIPFHASAICKTAQELLALSDKTRRFRSAINADSEAGTATDLVAILTDCLTELNETYPAATIEYDSPETVQIQSGGAIRFALTELLTNAIDHSDQQTPHVSVSVTATAAETEIRITDTGPGIPAAERQAFEDTTETPTDHAIGIGLWLVRWAVDSAGGELDYEAAEPRGSTVTVRLPSAGSADDADDPA